LGWKLSIITSKLDGRPLEAFVAEVYGKPQGLSPSGVGVDSALYPEDWTNRYALDFNGFGWVFDWELVERSFETPLKVQAPTWVFTLHSVVNSYGFTLYEKGRVVRSRWGSGDNGEMFEQGEPLAAERRIVASCAKPGHEAEAWAAWCDAEKTFLSEYDDVTHDQIGEDVIMQMIAEVAGFRIDRDDPLSIQFAESPVLAIEKERRSASPLSWLFGGKKR
jgi:hypothetical protein